MKNPFIALTASVMCSLCFFALWKGEQEFSLQAHLQKEVTQLQAQVHEQKMQQELMLTQFDDFRKEVALQVQQVPDLKKSRQWRDIASVIPSSRMEKPQWEEIQSRRALKLAQEDFEAKSYDAASTAFLQVVTQYPESLASLEASYYLVKTFYATENKQEALVWAEKMLRQFPDSSWTAKALLVSADIYREQDRKNDALEVYQMITQSFNEKEIREDIRRKMVELGE